MSDKVLLDKSFWENNDVLSVAQELIGCELVTTFDGSITGGIIVETEAYRGKDDKACHAYHGKRTPRNEVMYRDPGKAYIYLCYGIHHLLNFVCGAEGTADAVLIRAVEPFVGREIMGERRSMVPDNINLTNGPGKLSQALGIHTQYSGISTLNSENPLKIYKLGNNSSLKIDKSRRIGIQYAEECIEWEWRFTLRDNKYISKRP